MRRCARPDGETAMINPVLAALARARLRAAPMFARWCELHGGSSCPAAPEAVARFVADCATLGIERLWPAVQEISRAHVSMGLADPTLGGVAAAAINDVAGIDPPRAWPNEHKQCFKSLPYDLQVYVAAHEARREKEIRRAQNDAAIAKQKLAALQKPAQQATDGIEAHDTEEQRIDADAPA
jgi:hypothetical protein